MTHRHDALMQREIFLEYRRALPSIEGVPERARGEAISPGIQWRALFEFEGFRPTTKAPQVDPQKGRAVGRKLLLFSLGCTDAADDIRLHTVIRLVRMGGPGRVMFRDCRLDLAAIDLRVVALDPGWSLPGLNVLLKLCFAFVLMLGEHLDDHWAVASINLKVRCGVILYRNWGALKARL
jgi:hypothetical protein